MITETKKFLRDHPCYLVSVLAMALDGDLELLKKVYGGEKPAFDALQTARVYQHQMTVFVPSDYPLSVSKDKHIIKMPERFAGLLFGGHKYFDYLPCDLPPRATYGEEWLNQFTKKEKEQILMKYKELTHEEPLQTLRSDSGH